MTKNNARYAVEILQGETWKIIAVNGPLVCLRFSRKSAADGIVRNLSKADKNNSFRVRDTWI